MKYAPFYAAVAGLLLTSACSMTKEYRLSEKDSGKTLHVKYYDTIAITLKSNPTAGYLWKEAYKTDGLLFPVRNGDKSFSQPDTKLAGAPGTQTFVYRVIADGTTGLKLEYRRPWEPKTMDPANTFQLSIVASGKPVEEDTPLLDSGKRSDKLHKLNMKKRNE